MSWFNFSSKKRPAAQGFASKKKRQELPQAFILEPILTPSGLLDGTDNPIDIVDIDISADQIADIDIPEFEEGFETISDNNLEEIAFVISVEGEETLEEIPFVTSLDDAAESEATDEVLTDETPLNESLLTGLDSSSVTFESGVFTVGKTGDVSVDFLFDGGGYEGELAVFSLEGMEEFEPGSEAFIQEAASRALSDSELGHVVISDQTDGARFVGELGESDRNSGEYLGVKTVQMRPGDEFGFMLVPNNTVQRVFDNPDVGGAARPLFSMATANPDDGFHVGQIADVTGDGSTFVMEDLRVDTKSDGDYNDVIFQVRGATGEAALMDEVIESGKDWRETDLGQALIDYAIENLADTDTGNTDSGDIDTGDTDTGDSNSGDIDTGNTDTGDSNSGDIDTGDTDSGDIDSGDTNPDETDPVEPVVSYEFPEEDQPLIGVIDTGFSDDNPDIDYSQITLGSDRVDNDSNPLLVSGEGNEHGTHVLGIIAAQQDNDIGIDGINDDAPLWVGRAVGSGEWADSLVEFVDTAKESSQPNAVVNLSLDLTQVNSDGSVTTRYEFTPEERAAIEYARQNGVLIVAAAGNDGDVMSVLGQASQEFDNIITVGAAQQVETDTPSPTYQRAYYSSYCRGLDILAEGGTSENPVVSTVEDSVGTMAGTSVATAKVTGAASQVWAANPQLSYRQVIEVLKSTATDLAEPGWDAETGTGLLNLAAAVGLAQVTKPEDYAIPAIDIPETWSGEDVVTPMERAAGLFNQLPSGGVTAIASSELQRLNSIKTIISTVANRFNILPEIIAGIISRETNTRNILGDNGHGHGYMQLDIGTFPNIKFQPWYDAAWNIEQGVNLLINDKYAYLKPRLPESLHLRGSLAAYNSGQSNVVKAYQRDLDVDAYTTGKNYSADVLNRARWLLQNGWNGKSSTPTPSPQETRRPYIVRPDETLWGIAQRELNNGNRWREIQKEDGSTFTEAQASRLQVGQTIYLPVKYQTGTGKPVTPPPISNPIIINSQIGRSSRAPHLFQEAYSRINGNDLGLTPTKDAYRWGNGWTQEFRDRNGNRVLLMLEDGATKAFSVLGNNLNEYEFMGGAVGRDLDGRQVYLGYPRSDENIFTKDGKRAVWQAFAAENGKARIHNLYGHASVVTWGTIGAFYTDLGGAGHWLGMPTRREYIHSSDTIFSDFQGGRIAYNRNDGRTEALRYDEQPSWWFPNNIHLKPGNNNLDFGRGQEWITPGGYKFRFQEDGNLVLYDPQGKPTWATGTVNIADRFSVQTDGNAVLYKGDTPLWASDTAGNPGAYFAIQSDGNLVVYTSSGKALFSTGTVEGRVQTLTAARDWQDKRDNIHLKPGSNNLDFGRGQEWITPGGYKFRFQEDGNLVLYDPQGKPTWATGTVNIADRFSVQTDGNAVLYKGDTPLWASDTAGNPGAYFAIQSDGNLVVYTSSGKALFSTGTVGGRVQTLTAARDWQDKRKPPTKSGYVNSNVGSVPLNFRADAYLGAAIIGKLSQGTSLKILKSVTGGSYTIPTGSSSNDWYQVEVNGKKGYVAAYYIDIGDSNDSNNNESPLHSNPSRSNPLKGFQDPLKGKGSISQYPSEPDNYSHIIGERAEWAIDFGASIGTPVYAMRSGKVLGLRDPYPDTGGGPQNKNAFNYILIEHDGGYRSAYLHLQQGFISKVGISVGDSVKAGQLIGYSGNSGWSTAAHLHVEVHKPNNGFFGQTYPFEIEDRFNF